MFDVPPVLAARVRVLGTGRSQKNDPNDARSIAIAALRSDRLAQVRPDDHARVLRLVVKRHRDIARLRGLYCAIVELSLRFIRPASAGELIADASVVKRGRSIVHLDARVHDADGRLVATSSGTFATLGG